MEKTTRGGQSNEYFRDYYVKNRERILARNKAKYKENRGTPEKLEAHRKRGTEATRRWRERHPEKVKQVRKKQYDSRKHRAFKMVSTTGSIECRACGCDEISFLEINHVKGGGCKEHRESGRVATMERILKGDRKTDDLEILCRVCNALDFLERKSPEAKRFKIIWEDYSEQKAIKLN